VPKSIPIYVGQPIHDYMKSLLGRNVENEYGDQIERWKRYIDTICDAAGVAVENVKNTLTAAKHEKDEAQQMAYEFGLFAFSIFANVAVGWLAAAIQIKIIPKPRLATRTEVRFDPLGNYYLQPVAAKLPPSELFKTFVGNASQAWHGPLISLVAPHLAPTASEFQPSAPAPIDITSGAFEWKTLKSKLRTFLHRGQMFGRHRIDDYYNSVNNDHFFGTRLAEKLWEEHRKMNKPYKDNEDGYKAVIRDACAYIEKVLNDQRAYWATKWFYFGNNPPAVKADLPLQYERTIWANWLLDQNIKFGFCSRIGHMSRSGAMQGHSIYGITSDNGYFETRAVLRRLADIGFSEVLPGPFLKKTASQATGIPVSKLSEEEEPMWSSLLRPSKLRAEPGNPAATPPPSNSNPDPAELYTATTEADQYLILDNPTEQEKAAAQAAVNRLLNWAKTYKPRFGPMERSTPRPVSNIPIQSYNGPDGSPSYEVEDYERF
jgi:hypothetical protein